MSKGRKSICSPSRVQRILSAFSRLDSDAACTAREACDRAGERELRWYGKGCSDSRQNPQEAPEPEEKRAPQVLRGRRSKGIRPSRTRSEERRACKERRP